MYGRRERPDALTQWKEVSVQLWNGEVDYLSVSITKAEHKFAHEIELQILGAGWFAQDEICELNSSSQVSRVKLNYFQVR